MDRDERPRTRGISLFVIGFLGTKWQSMTTFTSVEYILIQVIFELLYLKKRRRASQNAVILNVKSTEKPVSRELFLSVL